MKTKRASKQARIQSFSIRTVNYWTSLPPEVVQAKSINQFKNLLDKHWEGRRFESPFTWEILVIVSRHLQARPSFAGDKYVMLCYVKNVNGN